MGKSGFYYVIRLGEVDAESLEKETRFYGVSKNPMDTDWKHLFIESPIILDIYSLQRADLYVVGDKMPVKLIQTRTSFMGFDIDVPPAEQAACKALIFDLLKQAKIIINFSK
jgi:hypothetical protein